MQVKFFFFLDACSSRWVACVVECESNLASELTPGLCKPGQRQQQISEHTASLFTLENVILRSISRKQPPSKPYDQKVRMSYPFLPQVAAMLTPQGSQCASHMQQVGMSSRACTICQESETEHQISFYIPIAQSPDPTQCDGRGLHLATHLCSDWMCEVHHCKLLNFLWHGGTEQQRLVLGGQIVHNFLDL